MAKAKRTRKPTEEAPEIQVTVSDARIRLTELVNRAAYGDERFVIVKRGKRIAAIIGAREPEQLDDVA